MGRYLGGGGEVGFGIRGKRGGIGTRGGEG